jgi:hypothetical protein
MTSKHTKLPWGYQVNSHEDYTEITISSINGIIVASLPPDNIDNAKLICSSVNAYASDENRKKDEPDKIDFDELGLKFIESLEQGDAGLHKTDDVSSAPYWYTSGPQSINLAAYFAMAMEWYRDEWQSQQPAIGEPTEETKQAVIAYFKEHGFALYKVEGIDAAYAELAEAKELLKTTREEMQWLWDNPDHFNRPANAINDINEFLKTK